MSYSKTTIVGKLGREPETRYTQDGTPVCNFSVATDNGYTRNGTKVTETTWYKVSAWGRQAETCQQYLHKGSMVLVEGVLTGTKLDKGTNEYGAHFTIVPRIWTGQDGQPRAAFELKAFKVTFLSRSGQQDDNGGHKAPQQQEEVPF